MLRSRILHKNSLLESARDFLVSNTSLRQLPSVKIIADSISPEGVRIVTFETEYWRAIHSELKTHRSLSTNSSSSRAIPIEKQIETIQTAPFAPLHWGANQSGMQAREECDNLVEGLPKERAWYNACESAIKYAKMFHRAGYHKQIVNRLLEPFAPMKTICTATEWDNFFSLRCHPDAQPEFQALALEMLREMNNSKPKLLGYGSWHLPYVDEDVRKDALEYLKNHRHCKYTYEEILLMISASCCAQVSYRTSDTSIDKSIRIYEKLAGGVPIHASPFEHQATPIYSPGWFRQHGITHKSVGEEAEFWSGNFRGWIQHRHLIPNNTCYDFNAKDRIEEFKRENLKEGW